MTLRGLVSVLLTYFGVNYLPDHPLLSVMKKEVEYS
jgi:hypothetical protein